ncbi:unnamed protein product, partial [Amoebophrya sp. A120]
AKRGEHQKSALCFNNSCVAWLSPTSPQIRISFRLATHCYNDSEPFLRPRKAALSGRFLDAADGGKSPQEKGWLKKIT